MRPIYFSVLIPIFSLIISGCDPAVEYSRVLQNDSDYDLWVVRDSAHVRDSSLLLAGMSQTLWDIWHIGNVGLYESCPGTEAIPEPSIFSVHVKNRDSLSVKGDLHASEGWIYSILSQGPFGSGMCECRRILTNTDID
ncbi:MAG: hypothetical protein AAF587_43950 [Bacteroidota bacterium]